MVWTPLDHLMFLSYTTTIIYVDYCCRIVSLQGELFRLSKTSSLLVKHKGLFLSSLKTSVIHFRNSNQLHIREVVHPSFLDSEDESQGGSIEGVAQCAGRGRGGAGEWQKVRCLDRSVIWRTRPQSILRRRTATNN